VTSSVGPTIGSIGDPERLLIPSIKVDAPVVPIEMDRKTRVLSPPADVKEVGWWTRSAHPGAESGQALITGHSVRLGDYYDHQPIVLTLNYLHCQNLCPLELDGLIRGLNGLSFTMGDEYEVITVSIDPRETPADALDARSRAVRTYVHPAAIATGWHILTTDHATIDRLADAVGFRYGYDPQADEFAHPAGVVVLTPAGRVSRYLYGIEFAANDLRLALVDAADQRIGSVLDRALLVCFHYDPATGRYTPLVMNILQIGGAATLVSLTGLLIWLWRTDPRSARPPAAGAA
jgi:protein SCO1/2